MCYCLEQFVTIATVSAAAAASAVGAVLQMLCSLFRFRPFSTQSNGHIQA